MEDIKTKSIAIVAVIYAYFGLIFVQYSIIKKTVIHLDTLLLVIAIICIFLVMTIAWSIWFKVLINIVKD